MAKAAKLSRTLTKQMLIGFKMIVFLKQSSKTYKEICNEFSICKKTAQRNIRTLETAGIPIICLQEQVNRPIYFSIDRRWKL